LEAPFRQVFTVIIISEPAEDPLHFEEFFIPIHFTVKAPELSLQDKTVPG
jgi:hypothetical protein